MSAAPAPSILLTAEQIIDRLLAEPALRKMAVDCVLPAVRVGNEWRFRESDLEAWISRRLPAQTTR